MTLRVMETKLHVPRWRAGNVARARLVAALEARVAAGSKLTLISAPPGYGKTTLAGEWVQRTVDGRRTLWLALDDADNQPLRFFSHWFAALARTDVSLSENLPPLTAMTHLPPVQTLVEDMLNALTQLALPLLIILDDYHVITEPQLHAALGLLHRAPARAGAPGADHARRSAVAAGAAARTRSVDRGARPPSAFHAGRSAALFCRVHAP